MTRKEKGVKSQQEILATALDIFIRKGFAAAKVQDIAQAVGVSVGLLFYHFESKEKLYEELVKLGRTHPKKVLDDIEKKSSPPMEPSSPMEPLEFFRTAAKSIIESVKTKPFVAKMFIFMKQAEYNEAAPESVKKLLAGNDALDLSIKKIRQGQKNGTIKKGDPRALAITFWGAMQGVVEQITLVPDMPVSDSEWIVDILRRRD